MQKKLKTEHEQTDSHQNLIEAREKSIQKMNLTSEKPFEWLNENSRKFLAAGYL